MKKTITKTTLLLLLALFGLNNNVHAQAPGWVWATDTIEGLGGMITDAAGNVYIAHNLGASTTFLSKQNSNGHTLWTKNATGQSTSPHGVDYPNSIAFDPSGNIFVSGYFTSDSIVLETTTIHRASALDMFLAKYTNTGSLIWATSIAVADIANTGFNVTCDVDGNAIVVGSFSTPTLAIGTTTLTNNCIASGVTCPTMLVAKFDGSNGNSIWADAKFSPTINGTSYAYSVVTDAAKNIYIGGDFAGVSGNVKYNSMGDTLWTQPNGGLYIAIDATGNIYTADEYAGVYKINPANGQILWSELGAGNISDFSAVSINTDATGNVYFAGQFDSDITFGTATLVNAGQSDIFIVSYDNNGGLLWAKGLGGSGNDFLNSSTTDATGNVYVGGFIIGTSATVPLGFDVIDTIRTSITYGGGVFVNLYFAKLGNNATTGITQSSNEGQQIAVYPNPNNGRFTISNNQLSENTTINITDALGREVYKSEKQNAKQEINLSNQVNGLYYLMLNTDEKQYRSKIIINK